jgi:hypothetical protein
MKKFGACVLMATVAMGNNAEKEKSTLEIHWKNSKGEQKTFKVNDIEKEFDPEQIKSKTFIQGNIEPIRGFECGRKRKGSFCSDKRGRSGSKSCDIKRGRSKSGESHSRSVKRGASCSVGKYRSGSGSCSRGGSVMKHKGQWRKSGSGSCNIRKGSASGSCKIRKASGSGSCKIRKASISGSCNIRKGSRSGSRKSYGSYKNRGFCGVNKGKCFTKNRGASFGSVCSTKSRKSGKFCRKGSRSGSRGKFECSRSGSKGKYVCKASRSVSRGSYCGKSRSKSGKNTFIVEHKPKYILKNKYYPRKKQNKFYGNKRFEKSRSNSRENCEEYNKDYDKNVKLVNLNDLEKVMKLQKCNNKSASCEKRSLSKKRYMNEKSNYLKDKESKYFKDNKEREQSCEDINQLKKAKKNQMNMNKANNKERQQSMEAKNSHNMMNINHKANEELCMKEHDKDNLHSNDKVIEEFDKLEHFKKIEERCRSASKGRNARVKKNNDLDKVQNQASGQKTKEKRGRGRLRSDFKKTNDDFKFLDSNKENRASQYMKNDKECSAEKLKERSCSARSAKSTCSDNQNRMNKKCMNYLDELKKTDCKNKNEECYNLSDDENCKKRSFSRDSKNEKECETDFGKFN